MDTTQAEAQVRFIDELKEMIIVNQAAITQLQHEKADMIMRNKLLHDRSDVPIERLSDPATVTKEEIML